MEDSKSEIAYVEAFRFAGIFSKFIGMLFMMNVFVRLMGAALVAGIHSVGDMLKTSDSKVITAVSECCVIYLLHRFPSSRIGQEILGPRRTC